MALIRRALVKPILESTAAGNLVLVSGLPRIGKTILAEQLAAAGRGVLLNARRREGRAFVEALRNGRADAAHGGSGLVVFDDASESDAKAIEAWLSAKGASARPMVAMVGGPFDEIADGTVRVAKVAMRLRPLSLFEAGASAAGRLWYRGGFPEAYAAASDEAALDYLEGYAARLAFGGLAAWGLPLDGTLAIRLLEILAESAGQPLNENAAARALGVSRPTVARYVAAFASAGLAYALAAYAPVVAGIRSGRPARASRSAALHLADPGLLHALRCVRGGAASQESAKALGAARAASWTSFVVAQAASALPEGTELRRYASVDGASIDIVALRDGEPILMAAARRHRPVSLERSISYAAAALSPERAGQNGGPVKLVVSPDGDGRSLGHGFGSVDAAKFVELLLRV